MSTQLIIAEALKFVLIVMGCIYLSKIFLHTLDRVYPRKTNDTDISHKHNE